MGGWVLGEDSSAHNPAAKSFKTGFRWPPVMGDGGCRFFGDIRELAGVG